MNIIWRIGKAKVVLWTLVCLCIAGGCKPKQPSKQEIPQAVELKPEKALTLLTDTSSQTLEQAWAALPADFAKNSVDLHKEFATLHVAATSYQKSPDCLNIASTGKTGMGSASALTGAAGSESFSQDLCLIANMLSVITLVEMETLIQSGALAHFAEKANNLQTAAGEQAMQTLLADATAIAANSGVNENTQNLNTPLYTSLTSETTLTSSTTTTSSVATTVEQNTSSDSDSLPKIGPVPIISALLLAVGVWGAIHAVTVVHEASVLGKKAGGAWPEIKRQFGLRFAVLAKVAIFIVAGALIWTQGKDTYKLGPDAMEVLASIAGIVGVLYLTEAGNGMWKLITPPSRPPSDLDLSAKDLEHARLAAKTYGTKPPEKEELTQEQWERQKWWDTLDVSAKREVISHSAFKSLNVRAILGNGNLTQVLNGKAFVRVETRNKSTAEPEVSTIYPDANMEGTLPTGEKVKFNPDGTVTINGEEGGTFKNRALKNGLLVPAGENSISVNPKSSQTHFIEETVIGNWESGAGDRYRVSVVKPNESSISGGVKKSLIGAVLAGGLAAGFWEGKDILGLTENYPTITAQAFIAAVLRFYAVTQWLSP